MANNDDTAKDNADEVELQNDGPDESQAQPKRTEQFPSLKGTEEGREQEVEQRSADGSDGTRFEKKFIVDKGAENSEPQHEANRANVLEDAIQRGLHPRGEVRFDGAEDITREPAEPGRRFFPLVELTYSVETIPAAVDTQPAETTTPRDQIESDDGSTSTPTDKPAAGATRRAEAAKAEKSATAKTSSRTSSATAKSSTSKTSTKSTAAAKPATTKKE
ncbi:hypothetical protein BBK82_03340 [Lentzea guizhouensis]|uniref:Uncharacterized protein n=1 Tax=Lentzea guizhouensis TaxID=1586287 RepID=A0A1B2HC19_9PSEU|nr:hypothetical protein [Lentzea guizhouensis]ANZ35249.1 hypothetical protein BBK82_03340 [Lentzea guizhouensis]